MAADHGKSFERRHAKRFYNGKRIVRPDYGVSLPDGESSTDTWECRDRKGIAVVGWFKERESDYASYTGERRFHLALHIPSERTDYVLCKADDYAELVRQSQTLALLADLGFKDAEWNP